MKFFVFCYILLISISFFIVAGDNPNYVIVKFAIIKCGGFIMNSKWVLTAAHCLLMFNNPNLVTIQTTTATYTAIGLVPHPDYVFTPSRNDLLLIRVDLPESVQSATFSSYDLSDGYMVQQLYGPLPHKTSTFATMNLEKCRADWVTYTTSQIFIDEKCACLNGNGDPLLSTLCNCIVDVTNDKQIHGVYMFGAGNFPPIYTKVKPHQNWIQGVIWQG